MNIVVKDKEGVVLGRLHTNDIFNFMEKQATSPFDVRKYFQVRVHYSARLWSILRDAHSLVDVGSPLPYEVEVFKVDVDRYSPFIIVECCREKVDVVEIVRVIPQEK